LVTTVYRVFPFLADAAASQPGGPLYIPMPGAGRLDNPDLFSVLYAGDSAAGVIAEAFGRFPEWTPAILEGAPGLPGSLRAIARYALGTEVALCDLDDPRQLLALDLRPSDVVTRDYGRTRAWARRIYGQHRWAGVRWWSYYDARWASIGLWDIHGLTVKEVLPLTLDTPALAEASRIIMRRIIAPTGHRHREKR
jgi:hypothetical protein